MRVLIIGAILAAERVVAAHVVRHLHLDDISAPVGKLPARRRPRPDLGEIDDAKAFQGGGGREVSHRSGFAISAGMRWQLLCEAPKSVYIFRTHVPSFEDNLDQVNTPSNTEVPKQAQ